MKLVDEFEKKLAVAESKLQYLLGQQETLNRQLASNLLSIESAEDSIDTFLKASTLLQLVSEKTREHSIGKIEAIVSQAIQEVFGDPALEFKVLFENKRGAVSVEFTLRDKVLKQDLNLAKCEAGGIKNIIACILRLVVIDLYHPKIEGPVIMDELGVHISEEHRSKFGKFLQQYSKLTGRQIILVTHLAKVSEHASRKIRVERNGTSSTVQDDG